jgi:hypothetical protein
MDSVQMLAKEIATLHKTCSNLSRASELVNFRNSIGYVDEIEYSHLSYQSLIKFHQNIFSQSGQDGIIEEILRRLDLKHGVFVEFGAWDGIHLSNCRYLLFKNWQGVFIEADPLKFSKLKENYGSNKNVTLINKFITMSGPDSLDQTLTNLNVKSIDLLSVDIDGLDYRVLETLTLRPKVIIMEGGAAITPFCKTRIPEDIAANNISQSLAVLVKLAKTQGYVSVCYFQDLYLVRNDLADPFHDYSESPIELYRDWYFALSNSARDQFLNHYRYEGSLVSKLEQVVLGRFEKNPLSYEEDSKIVMIDIPLNTVDFFNLRNQNRGLTREWLEYRISVFFKYTLRSLLAQTNKNFKCIVHVHEATFDLVKTILEKYEKLPDNIVFATDGDLLFKNISKQYRTILKLRLDSDNIIHPSFVDRLYQLDLEPRTEVIIGRRGYLYDSVTGRLAFWNHNSSAFNTYVYNSENYDVAKSLNSHDPEFHMSAIRLSHHFLDSDSHDGRSYIIVAHGENLQNDFDELINCEHCGGVISDDTLVAQTLQSFGLHQTVSVSTSISG